MFVFGGVFILFCVGLLFILFFGLWMLFSLLFGSIENTLLLFVIGIIRSGKVKIPFFLLLFSSFFVFFGSIENTLGFRVFSVREVTRLV
jgi:hypothetical protein